MNGKTISIGGVAHDLNNQIMIVLNSLDRLMIDHPHNEELARALKAVEQCAELAAQLLPKSSLPRDACSGEITVDLVIVREILCETELLVRGLLPSCNQLEMECSTDGIVRGVGIDVQQVLINLCLNAIQAMDGPGVIRLGASDEPAGVCLSVCDSGPGVPPALRDRIFDPLFTTRAARGGHGLGLARVRETVDRMGGSIEVCDVDPHGACFCIRLPRVAPCATLDFAYPGN